MGAVVKEEGRIAEMEMMIEIRAMAKAKSQKEKVLILILESLKVFVRGSKCKESNVAV